MPIDGRYNQYVEKYNPITHLSASQYTNTTETLVLGSNFVERLPAHTAIDS